MEMLVEKLANERNLRFLLLRESASHSFSESLYPKEKKSRREEEEKKKSRRNERREPAQAPESKTKKNERKGRERERRERVTGERDGYNHHA